MITTTETSRHTSDTDWTAYIQGKPRLTGHLLILRVLVSINLLLGFLYLSWRYTESINWALWPLALALIAAETYSYLDGCLFGMTMWRKRERGAAPPAEEGKTVDVFITVYNEPVELVRETVRAAVAMRYPHQTWVLDDGKSPAMRRMAEEEGAGYIIRTIDWEGRDRHAKAGNLNNALFQTHGEFLIILDADQIPAPDFIDQTLGYFRDPNVAFVQTPQWFYNVPPGDPFGSQAPLFYGPIQQGKDGWNAAFFCGSNAMLRREALMQIGIAHYSQALNDRVQRSLRTASRMLRAAERDLLPGEQSRVRDAMAELRQLVVEARRELRAGTPVQEVTWNFQRRAESISRAVVSADMRQIQAELAGIPGLDSEDLNVLSAMLDDDAAIEHLSGRVTSPLAAVEAVRRLLLAVDVDREDEAIPVMPMSTISVTEDMATAMRLHAMGWSSVYHHEVLAKGLAPEDLRTALQQRLRWAQGTMQVMLRENPLKVKGLKIGQRLMYFATMWNYLSGFFAVVYLSAPVLYLFFGWLPLRVLDSEFFRRLIPFLIANQILFLYAAWGRPSWRGQQYSLALFPIWIGAVTSAIRNVYFKRPLGFVVTPKTRQQGGAQYRLVRPQLVMMALLAAAAIWGLIKLAAGTTDDGLATVVNIVWSIYGLLILSVVVRAARYQPEHREDEPASDEILGAASVRGRAGSGVA